MSSGTSERGREETTARVYSVAGLPIAMPRCARPAHTRRHRATTALDNNSNNNNNLTLN